MNECISRQQLISSRKAYDNKHDAHSPLAEDTQAALWLSKAIRLSDKEQQQMINILSIRIFLACCVGTILHGRGIRSETAKKDVKEKRSLLVKSADDLLVAHEKGAIGYQSFCTDVNPNLPSDSSFFVIYNKSPDGAMKRITHYLDVGILDALKKGVLDAVLFTVSLNGRAEVHVTESYIVRIARIGNMINVRRAACSLKNSMMSLICTLCQLGPTPAHNVLYFGIDLFLREECPSTYNPNGFTNVANNQHLFADTSNDWTDCEEFDCGNYTAQVSVKQTMDSASQLQRDFKTKAILQSMQRSSSSAGIQIRPTISEPIDSDEQERGTIPTATGETDTVPSSKFAKLDKRVGAYQETRLPPLDFDLATPDRISAVPFSRSGGVRCECRDNLSPGSVTITCIICGFQQHSLCYGYRPQRVQNGSVQHVCYSCLLLPKDERLNEWMSCLVKSRLALQYLFDHQTRPATRQQLATAMRYSSLTRSNCKAQREHFHTVLNRLVEEEWISTSNDVIRLDHNANYRAAWESYLSPRAKIGLL